MLILLNMFRFGASYITKDDFNLLWAGFDPINSVPRRNVFVPMIFMFSGVVEVAPDEFVDVWFFSPQFMVVLSVFGDDGGFDCDTPCYIKRSNDFS